MSLKHFLAERSHLTAALSHELGRFMLLTSIVLLSACASHSAAQTPPPTALQVSAGGSATGSWSADEYFSGGSVSTGSTAVVNTLFDSRPAPQSVYQHDRFGAMTYTLPGLTAGASYTVNLHFAETSFTAVGDREFNVLINGTTVLTNFDIFAATGGENMAILKSFPATANSSGQIVIQFAVGAANNPVINGIEILPASTLFTSGGIYTLTSKTSGYNLDNEGSYTASNDVHQWSNGTGNTNQQWQLNLLPNGKYNLISLTSGMALDNGGSTTAGSSFTQYNLGSNNPNQEFTITSLGSGYYQLVVATSGLALDNDGATALGGEVRQWTIESGNSNQEWLIAPVQIGASTPFVSYEAESGALGGGATVVSLTTRPTTEFTTPALEASGHAYVNLSATGQSVTWTNNTGKNITFLNVRYSIPDSSGGGGITSTLDLYVNGTFRQAISVNSIQTWVYETSSTYDGMAQTPSSGNAHVFWDETNAFISGAAVAPGSTITLQKDSANSAAYYNIDVVDLEAPPAALSQPANSLSLTTNCGGEANNASFDNSTALQTCFNNAASQGKSVWIPQGTFYLNTATGGWSATGITIQGAGMWYSTLYYNPPIPQTTQLSILKPTSSTLENFALDTNATATGATGAGGYGVNMKGSSWGINSLWIRHASPAIWADGTGGTIANNRINNSWADGININNGNGGSGNNSGSNINVYNNFVRGSGDDGIALNDEAAGEQMADNSIYNNTSIASWWGNNIGIYGGQSSLVANNLTTDSVLQYGISVGVFASNDGVLNGANVQGNVMQRPGGYGYGEQHSGMGVGVTSPSAADASGMVIQGNSITNNMFNGLQMYIGQSMIISNNTVNTPQDTGFIVDSTAEGSANIVCNTALNISSGQSPYIDNAPTGNFTVTGSCNNGFTVP